MKHRVIITDDDPSVRAALGNLLNREGYQVALTASGDEALNRLVCEGPFDLMLLDLNMPGRNGWDTFQRVTALNPLLPVLLITARPDQHAIARAAGVSALAEKPLDLPQLLDTIRDLIAEPPINRLRRLAGRHRSLRHLPADPPRHAHHPAGDSVNPMRQPLPPPRRWLIALTLLAMVNAGIPPSTAQEPRKLTLAEARRLAFARNWDLLAAKADVDTALAQKIVAKEYPNPTLSLSTSKISFDDHPNATTAGNSVWNRSFDNIVAVSQLFEIGGKRPARRDAALAGLAGAEARLRDARRVLDQGVARAYVAVLQARDNVQILDQSVTSLRSEARIAGVRLKAGDISQADQMQIEIAAERLAQDARAAAAAERAARIAVDVLLGEANSSGDWVPGDSLETLVGLPFPASAESPGFTRPDLLAAQAAERKAEADLRLQRANRVPDPTVSLQYEHEQPDKPNTIGIAISIPLPLWNRNEGNLAAARAAITAAKVQTDKLRAQIAADLATARVAYAEASGRLQRYRELIRPKSEQVRKTVAFAYEKGGASLLDLLSAERNDNDVRLATAAAAADAATAAVNLKAALNFSTELEPK